MVERQDYIEGLRALASWLEANPVAPVPVIDTDFSCFAHNKNVKGQLSDILRGASGPWEKEADGNYYSIVKRFGPVIYSVSGDRKKVCRKVVTGTKIVPARAEYEVEEVEWICDDPLLAPSEQGENDGIEAARAGLPDPSTTGA